MNLHGLKSEDWLRMTLTLTFVLYIWLISFNIVRSPFDEWVGRSSMIDPPLSVDTAVGSKILWCFRTSNIRSGLQQTMLWESWEELILIIRSIAILGVTKLKQLPKLAFVCSEHHSATHWLYKSYPDYLIPLSYTSKREQEAMIQTQNHGFMCLEWYIKACILAGLVNFIFIKTFYQYSMFVVLGIVG